MKKPFYQSKTFWGAFFLFIGGGLKALAPEWGIDPGVVDQVLIYFGSALGVYGIRDALK